MERKKICLISQSHPSANPRLVKEADALVAAGYRVDIIAPYFSPQWGRADEEFCDRAWRIVARPQFGPLSPPLVRIKELVRRLLAFVAVKYCRMTWHVAVRAAWHPAAPPLVKAAKTINADLYIAHYPAALAAAAIAAKVQRAKYAYDAEDYHLGDLPDIPKYELQRRLIQAIEGRYLPGAAFITAASPGIADAYVEAYGIARPTVVLNVFPQSEAPPRPTPRGMAMPGPSLYWFSQTIGPDRGLECAVQAIGIARSKPHLYLRGEPAVGFLDRLHSIAESAGSRDRLHVLPLAKPSEMARLAAAYDVGLVAEIDHTKNRRIALTNKLFTYLLAGVPTIMSNIPAHRAIALDLGIAGLLYTNGDAASLAASIDAVVLDPAELAARRIEAWRLGQERFNWEIEQERLLTNVILSWNAANTQTHAAPVLAPHFRSK